MTEIIPVLTEVFFRAAFGVSVTELSGIINKNKTVSSDTENKEIVQSIEAVKNQLEDSKRTIDVALAQIEVQKKLYDQLKKEAEISESIRSMNQEQVQALNNVLEKTIERQDKKALPLNIVINLFFCVLSAVIGFFLGKYWG